MTKIKSPYTRNLELQAEKEQLLSTLERLQVENANLKLRIMELILKTETETQTN